jgi:4-hydroxybenzoate polyprenyltransferase
MILFLEMLRPYQWVKNILVFGGLIFSTSLFKSMEVVVSLGAFSIFCLASSGIYIINDLRDIQFDKIHPIKMNRPIASGKVPKISAIIIMLLLLPASLLFSYLLNKSFFLIIIAYISLNLAYSFGLKKVVILDAFIVAIGFLLRAFAGCVVINVEVTPWLFICTLSLALIVSFGKRRNEMNILKTEAKDHRESLQFYNVQFLDIILTICSATAIGTYSLYTMASETVLRFGSQKLIITTPFVMYGIFRYLFLIYTQNTGGDPTRLLIKDIPTIINGIIWMLCIGYLIYGSNLFSS